MQCLVRVYALSFTYLRKYIVEDNGARARYVYPTSIQAFRIFNVFRLRTIITRTMRNARNGGYLQPSVRLAGTTSVIDHKIKWKQAGLKGQPA